MLSDPVSPLFGTAGFRFLGPAGKVMLLIPGSPLGASGLPADATRRQASDTQRLNGGFPDARYFADFGTPD